MSSLPMDFSPTLEAFRQPLPVVVSDAEGVYIDGVWEWGEPVQRALPIKAIVLSLGMEQLAFYQEGNVAEGGIAVLTREPLYFTDILTGTVSDRQSFVEYQGRTFRVVGDGFISGPISLVGNASFKCYHCLRWIK